MRVLDIRSRASKDRKRLRNSGNKSISVARDRIQSEVVTGSIGMLLAARLSVEIVQLHASGLMPRWFWASLGFSLAFATVVWLLRSATPPAAAMGGIVCLNVLMHQELVSGWQSTAMPALLALFVLTFAATRFGRSRKESLGIAEPRQGRLAAQVIANLGVAGLLAAGGRSGSFVSSAMLAACIAALAEATADTVSSEVGQSLSGTRWSGATVLITTGRTVPAGTDGGVSVAGTAAGALAAAIVILVSPFAHAPKPALIIFTAACAGLLLDSILGATVERRGWLGNDLVNFSSTIAAAGLAAGAMYLV